MLARIRPRLTYANVVSSLCLFFVLGGGAYAAATLPANSVGTKQIKDKAVTGPKLAAKAVVSSRLATGAVTNPKLAPHSVTPDKLSKSYALASRVLTSGAITHPDDNTRFTLLSNGTLTVKGRCFDDGAGTDNAYVGLYVKPGVTGRFASALVNGSGNGRGQIVFDDNLGTVGMESSHGTFSALASDGKTLDASYFMHGGQSTAHLCKFSMSAISN